MKKIFDETVIRNAQTGYLTKDEYRCFQRSLRMNKLLAEKAGHSLLADSLIKVDGENQEANTDTSA